MSDSIKVAIKVRPLIKREKDDNLPIQWAVQGNSIVSTDAEIKRRGDGGFCFDHIFDMSASNSEVFETIVEPIVNAAVNGINGTVFAYGQTSSGKTYTMMGTREEPGIIPSAIEHMFDAITNTVGREFLLRVSYLEIYNERVNDLLNKSGTDLKLKEDGSGQVVLRCKEEITNCPANVLSIMKKGDKNRRIGETNMNERSSRSHTIFRMIIESRETGGDSDAAIQVSQLNLVDLAGSERARQTGATGERFKEGRHINMSLSTLGLVIMQLSESQDGQKHVNFRDSKLTRLLQNSLGGNTMTAIICAVTPAALEETQCTLSFASRAKSVKNKPRINEVMSDAALLKRYAKQLAKLQEELDRMKNENRAAEVEEMESKLQEKERINQLLEERIELLKTRIVSGSNASQEEAFKCRAKRRQTWGGPGMFNQHLPAFQTKSSLSTIKEVSFEKPERKSIIESIELMNQTFTTEFEDFELELFESERDRDSRGNASDEEEAFVTKRKNKVTFRNDVFTIKPRNNFEATPDKSNTSTQTADFQNSPSTPKHVLRRCITHLRKEFVELCEFTTLEKQLLCQANQCCASKEAQANIKQEEPQSVGKFQKREFIPEVAQWLKFLDLMEEENVERIIAALCEKLNECEKQSNCEKEANKKTLKQIAELEKQLGNVASERNEFEFMSRELRAELKKKTVEVDLRSMSEESIKLEESKKIAELQTKIENMDTEKSKLERVCAESSKKINELHKEVENVNSERREFEHMRRELCAQLNKKAMELESLKNNSGIFNEGALNERIVELQAEIENMAAEREELKRQNFALNQNVEESKSTVASQQTEYQKAVENVCELEKKLESSVSKNSELERVNVNLREELDKKVSDYEAKIAVDERETEKTMEMISEYETRIESAVFEKKELECVHNELRAEFARKVSELEEKIESEENENQKMAQKVCEFEKRIENMMSEKKEFEEKIAADERETEKTIEKVSEFEKQIETMMFEKKQLERINNELRAELMEKTESQEMENQEIMQKVSDFEEQIKKTLSEKEELERINNELRAELKERTESQEIENQEIAQKVSDFEEQIKKILSEKEELGRINNELRAELKEKTESQEMENQEITQKVSDFQEQIKNILSGKEELERINNELRAELKEKTESQEMENQEITQKVSDFEEQIKNILYEKGELERINNELRAELKEKTESQEMENQEVTQKVSDFEEQIKSILSEKEKLERVNNELRAELDQKVSEFEKQIENMACEKDELERINNDLRSELDKKGSEFEAKIAADQFESEKTIDKFSELEKQIASVISEKEQLERVNNDLRTELDNKSLEFEAKIAADQLESEKTMGKVSEFEKQIANMVSEKKELERVNNELRTELDQKVSELKKKIMSEEMETQKTTQKVSEFEKQIENIMFEKEELERINNELRAELDQKISESKEKMEEQQNMQRISELETRIESISAEREEFERINIELRDHLSATISELDSHKSSNKADKISELEHRITSMASEKQELERVNNELRIELNQKVAESKEELISEEVEDNRKTLQKISELEDQITSITIERDEVERVNNELRSELNNKSVELENQIAKMISEKAKLEQINKELRVKLNKKASALKAKIESEKMGNEEVMEMIAELEIEIENLTSTNEELAGTISELRAELDEKFSQLESLQTEKRDAIEEISKLQNRITEIAGIRNDFEQLNSELNRKSSELQSRVISEQTTNQELLKRIRKLENPVQNVSCKENDLDFSAENSQSLSACDYVNQSNSKSITTCDYTVLKHSFANHSQANAENLPSETQDLQRKLENQSFLSSSRINDSIAADASFLLSTIEVEKSQLEETVLLQSIELEDIKSDVKSLKTDIKNLQDTIYLLTSENIDMGATLGTERAKAKETEASLQKTIDELYARISQVTNEKITLESDLASLKEDLESLRCKMPAIGDEEQLYASLQSKMDKLTAENIELCASVTEKNKELRGIKESKSLLFEHECIYKEKMSALAKKNELLLTENDELSTDLMNLIEENDMMKEQCDILKSKVEQSLGLNTNAAQDEAENLGEENSKVKYLGEGNLNAGNVKAEENLDAENLKAEENSDAGNLNAGNLEVQNNYLKAEIAELKRKIVILSEENAKLSSNLLETMESLDSSRNERLHSNSYEAHLALILDDSLKVNESKEKICEGETREALITKIAALQCKMDHLTRLNKKLSDLKLTSCNQCAHLRNLNESRRTLKLETQVLNQKLGDLQRKFERKCADTESLKKRNEELSLSASASPNASFISEANVSFVEERIQSLNDELQTLKADHEKLSLLYEDKCKGMEELQSGKITGAPNDKIKDSASGMSLSNKGNRIEQMQSFVDELKKQMDEAKKSSAEFVATLKELKAEKGILSEEIKILKDCNEELQQKIVNNESTAVKKMQILENELANASKEIEQFYAREKHLESEKLMLEVELESFKAEEAKKNELIGDLKEHLSSLKSELNSIASEKNESINSNIIECKKEELECLRKQCEELEREKMHAKKSGEHCLLKMEEMQAYIKDLQKNMTDQESFCKELREKGVYVEKLLQEKEEEKYLLVQKLQTIEKNTVDLENFCKELREKGVYVEKLLQEKEQEKCLLAQRLQAIETNTSSQELYEKCAYLEKLLQEREQEKCLLAQRLQAIETNTSSQELYEKYAYLEKLLQEREQEKCILAQKLQAIESEAVDYKANLEAQCRNELNSMMQQHHHQIKENENNLQNLSDTLNKYIEENLKLSQEVSNLRSVKEASSQTLSASLKIDNEKLNEELNDIRKCMIKELRSLKCNASCADFSAKSVNEIFVTLLQTLVSKEEEVIKIMKATFQKEKKKIEEERRQCIDTEKRATIWAKELETEIEKLQTELTEGERARREYEERISQLEHLLRESVHEKEMFNEKMEALEADFNNLQAEFNKQCKIDSKQEEAIFVAQRREKEAQEIFKSKEMELQSKLESEKETYEKKIRNLVHSVESLKTTILELNGAIEGLEANEKQLKNMIEANSAEMKRNNQNAEKMNAEFEQLTQAYNETNQELEQKNLHIEEITAILKNKCDALSEYKTKFETILPEYEILKEHAKNQKSAMQRSKEEIEALKRDCEEQLQMIRDQLNSSEIQNAGLTKQLNELNNKNVALLEQLSGLEEKYKELQEENAKLERKIRNSTSKIKAEAEIEDLKELNKRLQNNLEGASNRAVEFQEMRNESLKELVELQGKYELLSQANKELEKAVLLCRSKHSASSSPVDEGKYDALLLEKNKIALELEDKKIILNQRDKEAKDYASQIEQLTRANKELDEEVEEYAAVIRERDAEISTLEEKLYNCSQLTENKVINELEEKLKRCAEEKEKLLGQIEALKMRVQMDAEDIKSQNDKIIRALKMENFELLSKINDYKKQMRGNSLEETSTDRNEAKELLQEEKIKATKELTALKSLLNQKDKQLGDCVKKMRELTTRNEELGKELAKRAQSFHYSRSETSKSEISFDGLDKGMKEKLEFLAVENERLKREIRDLRTKLTINASHERSTLKDSMSMSKQNTSLAADKSLSEYENMYQQLKKKIRELELQLVSKNGKIATLELQIQSENFPYQKKCKELEEHLLAFRNKNAELVSKVQKLQSTVNDVNGWECYVCRRWRVNRQDQACQTIPNNSVRFCSVNSGVVEDHVKIQKLEREKTLMKDLCRSRSRQIKELQDRVKELEEAQDSVASKTNEVLQDRSNQQFSNVMHHTRRFDAAKTSKS